MQEHVHPGKKVRAEATRPANRDISHSAQDSGGCLSLPYQHRQRSIEFMIDTQFSVCPKRYQDSGELDAYAFMRSIAIGHNGTIGVQHPEISEGSFSRVDDRSQRWRLYHIEQGYYPMSHMNPLD